MKWISTAEDLPIVGHEVLFVMYGKVRYGYYRGDTGAGDKVWEMYTMFGAKSVPAEDVERWMPLPRMEDTI